MYKLNNGFARGRFLVMVVGCGGTGGFAAESLCRLLPGVAQIILVDHDRVEETNLARQNFFREDIGKAKSEALALRLSRKYQRAVGYSTRPIAMTGQPLIGIVVGCVDNGLARGDIAEKINAPADLWWVDAGNGGNFGQILIGNSKEAYFHAPKETCFALPLPTLQRPELLSQAPPPMPQPECVEIPDQGPTINQVMAALVVEVVRRLIEGSCSWMQILLDMQTGSLHPVLATPETVQKIIGKKKTHIDYVERR